VWDLETGVCLCVLEGHTDWVNGVSVTPDSRRAVSASEDQTLRVWDLEAGVCLAVARLPVPVTAVAIIPVPGRMIVGTENGEVIQFDLHGLTWTLAEFAEPVPHDQEAQLRQETAACLRLWGESHRNTLLAKLGLAAVLDQAGKRGEASDTRGNVAKTCLSIEGDSLAGAWRSLSGSFRI
jgi:WD40 repeat protein